MKDSIFVIINSLYGGGAEHAASRIVKLLNEKYNVIVISLLAQTQNDYEFGRNIISIQDSHIRKHWIGNIICAAKKIDELANEYSPKTMISFLQNANLCLMMTKYKAQKIISIRNYIEKQYKGKKLILWSILIRLFFKRADKIVSVSQLINSEMIDRFKLPTGKCLCIYNPYDIDEIVKLSKEEIPSQYKDFYNSHTVISSMGRVSEQKGHFHLIRILKELNKGSEKFGLVIIGNDEDEYAQLLKKLVMDYNLNQDVIFTGQKKNPYKFIRNSFCYVFPSKYEGFPNALVEAMACSVPVIAADCKSGPREILLDDSEDYGFLIECSNEKFLGPQVQLTEIEKEYCDRILELNNNYSLYIKYSDKAFLRAQDFSAERIIPKWINLIENV